MIVGPVDIGENSRSPNISRRWSSRRPVEAAEPIGDEIGMDGGESGRGRSDMRRSRMLSPGWPQEMRSCEAMRESIGSAWGGPVERCLERRRPTPHRRLGSKELPGARG